MTIKGVYMKYITVAILSIFFSTQSMAQNKIEKFTVTVQHSQKNINIWTCRQPQYNKNNLTDLFDDHNNLKHAD